MFVNTRFVSAMKDGRKISKLAFGRTMNFAAFFVRESLDHGFTGPSFLKIHLSGSENAMRPPTFSNAYHDFLKGQPWGIFAVSQNKTHDTVHLSRRFTAVLNIKRS